MHTVVCMIFVLTYINDIREFLSQIFNEYSNKFGKNSGLVENSRLSSGGIVGSSVGGECLGGFQDFVASSNLVEDTRKSELDEYLKEGLFPMDNETEFDILHWWKLNGPKFPILARMAQDILAIPTSSVASKNSFSKCRTIITNTRSSLHCDSVETLMCVKDWLPEVNDGKSENVVEDGSSMMCDSSYSD